MANNKYRPGLLLAVFVLIGVQWYWINAVQRDIDLKLQQINEAMNTNSVLNSALITVLEKNKALNRKEVLEEAQRISSDIKDMIEKMQHQKQYQESLQKNDNITTSSPDHHNPS